MFARFSKQKMSVVCFVLFGNFFIVSTVKFQKSRFKSLLCLAPGRSATQHWQRLAPDRADKHCLGKLKIWAMHYVDKLNTWAMRWVQLESHSAPSLAHSDPKPCTIPEMFSELFEPTVHLFCNRPVGACRLRLAPGGNLF